MQIVCSQCQAEYEIDPPAAPFGRLQDLVFRCTACGSSIAIREELAPEPSEPVAVEPAAQFVLRQNGKSYNVKDSATMQRWIVERRVWVDDEVSVDGGAFTRIGGLDEFEVFFKLVSDADRATFVPEPSTPTAPTPPNRPPSNGQEADAISDRTAHKTKNKSLFARPVGLSAEDPSAVEAEASQTASVPLPKAETVVAPAQSASDASVAVPERSVPTQDAVPVTVEEWELGEMLPDDSGASVESLSTVEESIDSATKESIDMELDEEDFFSEEQSALALSSLDDEDDEFEWGQKRRGNMVVWWLLFLGALGGSGYGALEWLNRADDSAAMSESTDAEAVASAPTPTDVSPNEPMVDAEVVVPAVPAEPAEDAKEDATDAEVPNAPSPTPDAPAATSTVEPASDASEPTNGAPAPTASPPTQKAAPAKPSASRETDRGWAQIDRGNYDAARNHFNAALAVTAGYADARFGLAYVNEKQGRVDEAVRQYCGLSTGSTGSVKSEAEGRLRSLDRTCP